MFITSPRSVTTRTIILPLSLLICISIVLGEDVMINTPQGFIDFSTKVNSGTSYSGVTVYLDSDLDFSSDLLSSFEPIGSSRSCSFQGTFDGKGNVISNLTFSGSLQYVGLFGYLNGATIKNVVIDETCSFVNSYSYDSDADIGSVAGYCSYCTIENTVNMASVAFAVEVTDCTSHIGGIIGRLIYSSTVRNCVNYGSIKHSGTVNTVYIGGIIGSYAGDSLKYVHNCANYGTIIYNGTSSGSLNMGGICGYSALGTAHAENCLSAGKFGNTTSSKSIYNHIGSITGYIYYTASLTINHCIWTNDVGYDAAYNTMKAIITNSSFAELNTTTMNEMNIYAEKNSTWDKWFMLHLNGGTINSDVNQETLIVTQKHFPDPVKEGSTFLFWCIENEIKCTDKYNPKTTDISGVTDLYAMYTSVVTFNFGNGTKTTKVVIYGEKYGDLPEVEKKEGYTFNGWFTAENGNGKEISSDMTVSIINDHTLYAYLTVKNYTLTFIFDNGEVDETRIFNYSDAIIYPNDPVKEGYTFTGWDNNDITTMPAHNLNITARWIKIETATPPWVVEIVFGKKDLTEEDIKELIVEHTNEGFVIEKIVVDEETGNIKVIIKFSDKEVAENFIETIKQSSDNNIMNIIASIDFIEDRIGSFSISLYPILFTFFYLF